MTDLPDHDAAYFEAGERLFRQEPRFMLGAVALGGLPPEGMPEVAFAGRSNVGKSSLINALTGRRQLARASNTPGRTQEVNFFDLAGRIHLVDLPGYGFAQAPRDKVDAWNSLIRLYLKGRSTLRRVFVLIDARHGVKPVDEEIMKMLDSAAVSYQGVLTKTDKLKPAEVAAVAAETVTALRKRVAAHPTLLATSSEKKEGLDELKAEIAALALADQ